MEGWIMNSTTYPSTWDKAMWSSTLSLLILSVISVFFNAFLQNWILIFLGAHERPYWFRIWSIPSVLTMMRTITFKLGSCIHLTFSFSIRVIQMNILLNGISFYPFSQSSLFFASSLRDSFMSSFTSECFKCIYLSSASLWRNWTNLSGHLYFLMTI